MRRDEQSKVTSSRELLFFPVVFALILSQALAGEDELAGKRATLNAGST